MVEVHAGDRRFSFGDVTYVMGVMNVSPESRNPHTVVSGVSDALSLADRYRLWGADLIDLGGQSSHFDSPTLDDQTEIDRLLPIVEALIDDGHLVSVDTWKPAVAAATLAAGAHIVNDTGGLGDEDMVEIVANNSCAVVAVHVDGADPHNVGEVAISPDKASQTAAALAERIEGLPSDLVDRLIIDPGIAINYRGDYGTYTRLQLDVIRNSAAFRSLQRPLLIPIPRKRDIHWVSAYIAMALEYGADMIRVHDVAIASSLVRLWDRAVPR